MNKFNIIIVEDDTELAKLTSSFLEQYEFNCHVYHSAEGIVDIVKAQQPDLVLLDIMLPDGDGLEICRQIKEFFGGKIVMLTACKDPIDQVLGLETGADDYIPKPVLPRLLLAKCRAILRREPNIEEDKKSEAESKEVKTSFNDIEIDLCRREVLKSGAILDFSNPEYELLLLLIQNRGEIVSRDAISLHLRGVEYDGQSRQIDMQISAIRNKLCSNNSHNEIIKTVRSKGYVFIA